jgi:hypothetical protein
MDAAAQAAADLDFSKWWTADELTPEALGVLMGFRPEEGAHSRAFAVSGRL